MAAPTKERKQHLLINSLKSNEKWKTYGQSSLQKPLKFIRIEEKLDSATSPEEPSDSAKERKRNSYINSLESFLTELQEFPLDEEHSNDQLEHKLINSLNELDTKLSFCASRCNASDIILSRLKEHRGLIDSTVDNLQQKKKGDQLSKLKSKVHRDLRQASKSGIVCPCCFTRLENTIALFLHLETDCSVLLTNNNYSEPSGAIYHIVANGIKCNRCGEHLDTYEEKSIHEISGKHRDTKSKDSGLKPAIFCSICREMIPDSYIQVSNHIFRDIHNNLKSFNRETLIKHNNAFILFQTESLCVLCQKTLQQNALKIHLHTFNVAHRMQLASYPGCDLVWCPFCDEDVNVKEIGEHQENPVHCQKAEKVFLCSFCEEDRLGLEDFSKHFKRKCLAVNELRAIIFDGPNEI